MCKWMLFLSTGNIQQNYCFFSKDFWELSVLSDMRTRTEYLPCDWVFYRKFIKDCLILLSSLCSQSNKWVSRFQLLLGFVGCFFMDSTGLSILALGLSEMARSIDQSEEQAEAHGLFSDFCLCFPAPAGSAGGRLDLGRCLRLIRFPSLCEGPWGWGECPFSYSVPKPRPDYATS